MANLVDIETQIEPPTIGINGKAYELRLPDALPLSDYLRMDRLGPQFSVLWRRAQEEDLTDEERQRMETTLDTMTRIVLVAPDHVHAQLKSAHRIGIYSAFLKQPMPQRPATSAKTKGTKKAKRRIGVN